MPALRLPARGPGPLPPLAVVGIDADDGQFVRHVGLAAEGRDPFGPPHAIPIAHMVPPFESRSDEVAVQTCGFLPLSAGEAEKVALFIDEIRDELHAARQLEQYTILPHADAARDADGMVLHRKFSCAGFVVEAYRFAVIDLVATAFEELPTVGLDAVCRAYPEQRRHLENPRLRERMNLRGPGPWPILLPGYVINALCRPAYRIRAPGGAYRPRAGDEFFPHET
ncbi:MAG: hypothetical protein U0746_08940 [Gemmataceae bacterium]